ncbi:hypothetical protein [Streptomyces sp. NBC_01538]|uniref:hypothetical protein n=1 Tax=Streptomyces sp. NBC_01538 TaxID=2903897 RepID=UPI0038630F8B
MLPTTDSVVSDAYGGGREVETGHRHAREDERDPGQGRVATGEQQLDEAAGAADPGERVVACEGLRPGAVVRGLLDDVQDLGQDERRTGGEGGQGAGAPADPRRPAGGVPPNG